MYVRGSPQDRGNTIELNILQRGKLKVSLGECVKIEPCDIPVAKKVLFNIKMTGSKPYPTFG